MTPFLPMAPARMERERPPVPAELACPICHNTIPIDPRAGDGSDVGCALCGEMLVLTREYVEEADAHDWVLADPDDWMGQE